MDLLKEPIVAFWQFAEQKMKDRRRENAKMYAAEIQMPSGPSAEDRICISITKNIKKLAKYTKGKRLGETGKTE